MSERPAGDDPAEGDAAATSTDDESGRLQCQFCGSYSVGRMYLASTGVDSCECQSCGARWEEERASGRYLGRGRSDSVITNRSR